MAKVLVYQLWPIAWKGGLPEMTEHLTRIKDLGATHVWVSPLYKSPRCDHGYDVEDYRKIDKRFGTIGQFDDFVSEAHGLGLKVLMDMVLNHTSIKNPWFKEHPDWYCWSEENLGWKGLFGGDAWTYDKSKKMYYCHLFDKGQPDLDWFPDGNINSELVAEFRDIVRFWTVYHKVDGFRLDVPQSINKDFSAEELNLGDLLAGDQAISVINAVFSGFKKKPFLMMECLDPTFGVIGDKYIRETPVDYYLNIMVKEQRDKGVKEFFDAFYENRRHKGFMVDLESHDSPRFTSRSGMLPRQIAHIMFDQVNAACIYQGQELGLKNPNNLTVNKMRELDAQSAAQLDAGMSEEEVRKTSRANARVSIPTKEYKLQAGDVNSPLNWYKFYIGHWKKTK